MRTDLAAFACFAVVVFCVLADRWPVFAGTALVGVIFLAVSPRMKGTFGFKSGNASIGGEFADPFDGNEEIRRVEPGERLQLGPAPDQEPPPRTESAED
jgi:hypothetical protein